MALKDLKRSENTSEPLNRLWAGERQRVKEEDKNARLFLVGARENKCQISREL